MLCYRISRKKYAGSLSGEGAKRYGGRWNSVGTPIIYAAATSSLAMLEILVHVNVDLLPDDYQLITIEIPDNGIAPSVSITDLPVDWGSNPFMKATKQLGDAFYKDGAYLALSVPSAVNRTDTNILINPDHVDFKQLKIVDTRLIVFDERLFK